MIDQRYDVFAAGERDMLEAVLDFHREAMLRKTSDLGDDQLRASPVPSGTNLIGLVHHLTRVEEWWFEGCFAGRPFDGDPPHEHEAPVGAGYEEIVAGYRRQCDRSREITRQAQPDDVAELQFMKPTLRWVLVHMIEETARHNGQADVIRELTDGEVGE